MQPTAKRMVKVSVRCSEAPPGAAPRLAISRCVLALRMPPPALREASEPCGGDVTTLFARRNARSHGAQGEEAHTDDECGVHEGGAYRNPIRLAALAIPQSSWRPWRFAGSDTVRA